MQQEHRECIEQCYECAAACDICASSCLREDNVEMMKHCIQLDMQCAAICRPGGAIYGVGKRVLTKIMPPVRGYLQSLCRRVCKARSRPLPELRAGMQPMRRRLP